MTQCKMYEHNEDCNWKTKTATSPGREKNEKKIQTVKNTLKLLQSTQNSLLV